MQHILFQTGPHVLLITTLYSCYLNYNCSEYLVYNQVFNDSERVMFVLSFQFYFKTMMRSIGEEETR